MMPLKKLKSIIQNHIKNGRTEKAINILLTSSKIAGSDSYNELLLLSNRFQEQKRNKRLAIVSTELLDIEKNKISLALLETIDGLNESEEEKLLNKIERFSENPLIKYSFVFLMILGILLLVVTSSWLFSKQQVVQEEIPLYTIMLFALGIGTITFSFFRTYSLHKGFYISEYIEIGIPCGLFLMISLLGAYQSLTPKTVDYVIYLTEKNREIPTKGLMYGKLKIFFEDGSFQEENIMQGIVTYPQNSKLKLGQLVVFDLIDVKEYALKSLDSSYLLTDTPLKIPLEKKLNDDKDSNQSLPDIQVHGNNTIITILGDSSQVHQTIHN